MALPKHELKALALELAAAMPPIPPADHQELSHYPGMIGACLESALDSVDDVSDGDNADTTRQRLTRASWLIRAAMNVNDQLARETNLR